MYKLAWHKSFRRAYKKIVNKNPEIRGELLETLNLMQIDPFVKKLKTHKLHGILKDFYACAVNLSIRIIFSVEEHNDEKIIALIDIGTHDEVY